MKTVLFGLAAAALLALTPALPAQEAAKLPPLKPAEAFQQLREHIGEGRYDVAAIYLKGLLDSNPTDKDFLDLEARFGSTAFSQLRTIPKWSDDPNLDKQARADVETLVKRAREAADKALRNPARVNTFIRNLGESYEERLYAERELKRTGNFAIPYMVDAFRNNQNVAVTQGIREAIPKLESQTMAGWLAALDGLSTEQQYDVLARILSRDDVLKLITKAQTDFRPYLWRAAANPDAPSLQKFAKEKLEKLALRSDRRNPARELIGFAQVFADHKAVYIDVNVSVSGTPSTVPVWTWNAATQKLIEQPAVPTGQADEYFGLRYARWVLERTPDYEPAQVLVLSLAAERAMDRGKFGELAKTDPAVYRMLADAPSRVLADLLDRGLVEKRTGLVLALVQSVGDRAEKGPALPTASGKPSLLERSLDYPDPRVQLAAANALLRAPIPVPEKVRGKVLDVLRRAAGADLTVPPDIKGQALIADPNRQHADETASLLRALGYDIEFYTTGRELLQRASRTSDFDLIVIDRHILFPEISDLVPSLRRDPRAARRPILIVASLDHPNPPSFEQLLLRFALLIAATETDAVDMPAPYVPNLRRSEKERMEARETNREHRDHTFRVTLAARVDRLERIVESLGMELTDEQKFQAKLRVEQVTAAVLAAEFPMTPESSPRTYANFVALQKQLGIQPPTQEYQRRLGIDQMMKLIERLEIDVMKNPPSREKFERLRARVDAESLGLRIEPTRDVEAEARLVKQFRTYPAVRVIAEPPTRFWLEADLNAVYQNPAERPRDPAEKRAGAKLAIGWLAKMATGAVPGFDASPAAAELIAALRSDDTAGAAIDGVARFPTAAAQQALLSLALTGNRPIEIRIKAADAAIRHMQVNGKLTPPTLIAGVIDQAKNEADAELRSKLLVLKGLLAPDVKSYLTDLKNYSPPLAPPAAPPAPMPEPKPKQE